jgi:putative two-component system response regulator
MSARILVADDEPISLKLISDILGHEGYAVIQARDGREALELAAQKPVDIMLLDINMPALSGLDVLERVRGSLMTRLLPVVLLTASGDAKDKRRAIDAGATDFINKPFESSDLVARVRSLLTLKFYTDEMDNAHDMLKVLIETIDARDRYTSTHSSRVAYYAQLLGQSIGLGDDVLTGLKQGAIMHDFGKIAIRDAVLLKPGKLTEEEFDHVKIHPVEGKRMLKNMRTMAPALPIIYHHHEKLDGSGYPDGLSDRAIPLPVRITSIADIFDALTTDRPYRSAYPTEEAFRIMLDEAKKGWWDLALVDHFRGVIEKVGG